VRRVHGEATEDPYTWLRNREDPDTLAYLEAENAWTTAQMQHTQGLRDRLFQEIRSRIQETDLSVPVRKGPWWYYSRTEEGKQYSISCRRRAVGDDRRYDENQAEHVLLDQNVEADNQEFFSVGVFDMSPDHHLLAYGVDTSGGERYHLRFRDLDSGENLPDEVADVYYGSAWAADNEHFFYVRPDEAMRPYQLWRHRLGTPASADELVYQEDDERFFLGIDLTKDERYLVLHLGSKVTDECWLLDADRPTEPFRVVEPRCQDVEYGLEHHDGRFLVVTNADGAENFKLMEAPADAPARANWREVIPHRPDVKLSGIDVFAEHLLLFERSGGLQQIRVRRLADDAEHLIDQLEAVGTATGSANPEFATSTIRYGYQSMITPSSVFEYDLETRERRLLKQQPVLGGYDPSDYVTERLWAPAEDGVEVPISVVYRRGLSRDGSAPALLYGYGSYESSMDPYFSSVRLSLLDRGFVFAIAHVRGGGEMGRRWYLDGKYLHKKNTFTDFVACARHLCAERWTSPDRLAIRGGSAGGLLMGAVVNMAPQQFGAVIAEVPFVDCLNTILDPSLPLTVLEWEEWGNPVESKEYFDYIRSYAPYENVEATVYPPMLVTAGLNDPRVSYWEPAKWVAKLRATQTGNNRLLLKTEMGAGHMGPSGRYDAWRDEAFVLAFVLDTLCGLDASGGLDVSGGLDTSGVIDNGGGPAPK
jgi:oligopeptidase B